MVASDRGSLKPSCPAIGWLSELEETVADNLWDPHSESWTKIAVGLFVFKTPQNKEVILLFLLPFSACNARKSLESGPQHCGQVMRGPIQELISWKTYRKSEDFQSNKSIDHHIR